MSTEPSGQKKKTSTPIEQKNANQAFQFLCPLRNLIQRKEEKEIVDAVVVVDLDDAVVVVAIVADAVAADAVVLVVVVVVVHPRLRS